MADINSILNQIGQSKDVLNNKKGSPLSQLLVVLMQDVIDQIRKKSDDYDVNASNQMKQSFKPTTVEINGDEVSVGVSADFYWKFIDKGVNGTERNNGAPNWGRVPQERSFKQNIEEWIRNRGITLPQDFRTYDQLAYAIMTNKRKYGQKARPFVSDVIESQELRNEMQAAIEKVLGRAITLRLSAEWQ